MNEKKEKNTQYDRLIKSLKNNSFIVFIMILFLTYISVTKLIQLTAENMENIPKILGEEDNKNKQDSTKLILQKKVYDSINKKKVATEKKFSFFLVLNSDQINSKILIDGKPAKIISGQNMTYQEIEVNELDKEYHIILTNENYNCKSLQYLSTNHQKVYPCR